MRNIDRAMRYVCVLLLINTLGYADDRLSGWLYLDADSKSRLRHLIQSDVERRNRFTTISEAQHNTSIVMEENRKVRSAYKASIDEANREFQQTKKELDDLATQVRTVSYDLEETIKNYDTLKAGISNIDRSIARYQTDKQTQVDALKRWLKTTKQGDSVVAAIYTRGFMHSAHQLEQSADQASAHLMAKYMGVYIRSSSKISKNVLTSDFIRAVEEGSVKWNREEPIRIALKKDQQGTTFLRIKRYELYPFQAPDAKRQLSKETGNNIRTSLITSMEDLTSFLEKNNFSANEYDFGRMEGMIRDTGIANRLAEKNQREQLGSFNGRITYLEQKIASAKKEQATLYPIFNAKGGQVASLETELKALKQKKREAELAFQNAQAVLLEKKRAYESIIVKSSLVNVKRSQTPAEASAEAVLEGLKDVLNDARIQHYASTTDVLDGKFVDETKHQAFTEAKIIAVRPLAFINEGESIRVKIAFRVRTVLDTKQSTPAATESHRQPASISQRYDPPKEKQAAIPQQESMLSPKPSVKRKSAVAPVSPSPAAVPKMPKTQRLFVNTVPVHSTVRVMNIAPKFYQGMVLKAGWYHLEVSAAGYNTEKISTALVEGEDKHLNVRLKPKAKEVSTPYQPNQKFIPNEKVKISFLPSVFQRDHMGVNPEKHQYSSVLNAINSIQALDLVYKYEFDLSQHTDTIWKKQSFFSTPTLDLDSVKKHCLEVDADLALTIRTWRGEPCEIEIWLINATDVNDYNYFKKSSDYNTICKNVESSVKTVLSDYLEKSKINRKEMQGGYGKTKKIKLRETPSELYASDLKEIAEKYDLQRKIFKKFSASSNEGSNIADNFVDNADGTITDVATGLMWQKGGSNESLFYQKVKEYVNNLNKNHFAQYSDWRLPTLDELCSLVKLKKDREISFLFDPKQTACWSSDYKFNFYTYNETKEYYVVDFNQGLVKSNAISIPDHSESKRPKPFFVKCVRSLR